MAVSGFSVFSSTLFTIKLGVVLNDPVSGLGADGVVNQNVTKGKREWMVGIVVWMVGIVVCVVVRVGQMISLKITNNIFRVGTDKMYNQNTKD